MFGQRRVPLQRRCADGGALAGCARRGCAARLRRSRLAARAGQRPLSRQAKRRTSKEGSTWSPPDHCRGRAKCPSAFMVNDVDRWIGLAPVRASTATQSRRGPMKFRLLAAVAALALGSAASAAPVLAPRRQCLGPRSSPTCIFLPGRSRSSICGSSTAPARHRSRMRRLLIEGAKIGAILPAGSAIPAGYRMLDGTGETALPGLVGMHNHLYYLQRPNLDAPGNSSSRSSSRK